jgi:hypothetical protein
MNYRTTTNRSIWWGLLAFHVMNSVAIIMNARSIDLDSTVSLSLGAVCIYALRRVPEKNKDARKSD